jgi:predicted permease
MNTLRFAFRQLIKNPGFALAAILCLGLGIGASTAVFSIVNTVMLRPLPYSRPDDLIRSYTEFPGFPNGGLRRFAVSPPEYIDLKRLLKTCDTIDAWQTAGVNISSKNEPARVTAAEVTETLLNTLGVSPLIGRLLTPADDQPGVSRVANISFGLWQRMFAGDPAAIGQDVLLMGRKCTVVGVMPRGFQFPPGPVDAPDVWTPLQIDPANPGGRGSHDLSVIARLKTGVTRDRNQAELSGLVKRWKEFGATDHGFDPSEHTVLSFGLQDEVVRSVKPALRMLLGAVCFVLLIACVNVANLLLARAEARQKEIAIRGAIGASLKRLTYQFLAEGLVLSFFGAVLGLLFAQGGLQLVRNLNEASIPRASEISLDPVVILFALGTCVLIGMIFGLTPVFHAAKQNLQNGLKSSTGATTSSALTQRFRHGLVVVEIALALVLLVGTGLMLRAFWNRQQVNAGFNPENVVAAYLSLPDVTYPDIESISGFWNRLQEKIVALPGVENVALASGLPPIRGANNNDTEIEGFVPEKNGSIQNVDFYQLVSKEYFRTIGIHLIEGRVFDERDGATAPDVAVINQTLARTFWGNQSPIGRRLKPRFSGPWCTIIGVVADVKNAGVEKPTGTELYLPISQSQARYAGSTRNLYLLAHSALNVSTLVNELGHEVNQLDPSLPFSNVHTMSEVVTSTQSRPRFLSLVLSIFSAVALILAAVGIYGVISYSVAQRTKEFGVRIALGAQRKNVLGLVLGRGMAVAAIGLLAGLVIAFAVTRLLSSLLFGVTPTDPATFAVVSSLLTLVAFFASYIPARRATKVDPMTALRNE